MMLSNQSHLPHLPVPTLEESLKRYLRVVRPLVDDEDYAETERAFTEFVTSDLGHKLQTALEERAEKHENWLYEWWLKGSYLEYRDPLVLFSSPSYHCPPQKFNCPEDQFRFAAGVISQILEYRETILKHEIKPEVVGKDRHLCMVQYTKIFDGYRVPIIPCDKLLFPDLSQPIKEMPKTVDVVIAYRNNFFQLQVDTSASDPQTIFDTLITLKKLETPALHPVGIMTAWHRNKWAEAYEKLEKASEVNAASLDVIRRAAFVLCLDTKTMKPEDPMNNNLTRGFDNVLHGGGSSLNTSNRWFDKTLEVCVTPDGLWGFCQEHAPLDAPPTITMIDTVSNAVVKAPEMWRNLYLGRDSRLTLKQLHFKLTPELEKCVADAVHDTDKIIGDIETHVQICPAWGRDEAKNISVSADSLLQVAYQVGYYRMHGSPACCYETASTRRFALGRTETIRPCTVESLALCKELSKEVVGMGKVKDLLMKALASHQEYSNAALSGRGIDRHFTGLKRIAAEIGLPPLTVFQDKSYQKTNRHLLSTSQATGPYSDDAGLGYGPLQPDGYGACYNIRPHRINLMLSAWRSCPTTDPHRLGKSIADALAQLYTIASFEKVD